MEYDEESVKCAYVEAISMVNLKEFKINISAGPDIQVHVKTRDPCDALCIASALVQTLRQMDKEPKWEVLP